ncbi:hypothetical protein LGVB_01710 (plasmid) [Lactobacillus gasseri]|jgi:hypothetical protein|uniref:hypothetical protein n=1 Tax=Limosilactobacillus TaxID=2742598 RepID=UPI001BDBC21A|nr:MULTISPECIES: hypothetical protein [Limosilactobacillus]MBS7524827.1 hypothetical protein [Lactobacillus gasseri]NTP54209.1 hypothetical protein [Enterococcus faecium]WEZ96296.1 hypothetical protein P3T69_17520 [Lactiplantibacillus plantarum]MBS7525017.1 hypothetical protein [Lactobacillus gasseri]MCC4456888.1 hypothetical protein [Limosilactobacillus reuteri]
MPTSLELQEAKLKDLNQRIKNEKLKIDQRLGHQLIKQANLDYGKLSMQEIKSLSVKLAEFLNQENQSTSTLNSDN